MQELGVIISPKVRPRLLDVIQVNPRLIHVCFKKQGGNIHLLGAYAPHSGLDLEEERIPFWDEVEDGISKIPLPEPLYLTGDFNVRFQARHKHDGGVLGPFVYGKGSRHIDHNSGSNRTLCINFLKRQDMLEVASFRTPNMLSHVTYRDKAAPPKDWSQFLLDPLILQQVYDKIHFTMEESALLVASKVRSYLEMDSLLPPPKLLPQVDPVYFQRLDHTFTRKQWLNSVNSCKSKLRTGFPSDHYLLVTDIKIKLSSRSEKTPKPPKMNFIQDEAYAKSFNDILREFWGEESPPSDHNSEHGSVPGKTVYTDGSGSRGRCSKTTPAGWGWCYQEEEQWVEAFGPVVTDPDSLHFRGAQVGSNNTGELTAILEALTMAIDKNWQDVTIRSDSQWSINVITGKWKARSHKTLVNYIKSIIRAGSIKVRLSWIKAHAGHEGNERADRLAEEGKQSLGRFGTTSLPPEFKRTELPSAFSVDPVSGLSEASRQVSPHRRCVQGAPGSLRLR